MLSPKKILNLRSKTEWYAITPSGVPHLVTPVAVWQGGLGAFGDQSLDNAVAAKSQELGVDCHLGMKLSSGNIERVY